MKSHGHYAVFAGFIILAVAIGAFLPILHTRPSLRLVPISLLPQARHRPANPRLKVWVNTRSGFYYCRDSPLYGKMSPGVVMGQAEALQKGYRTVDERPCGALSESDLQHFVRCFWTVPCNSSPHRSQYTEYD